MKFEDVFSKLGLLKIFLVITSMLLWIYFYVSSNVTLNTLVVFNIPSFVNTYLSTQFLLFLLFFPITSAIIISFSLNKDLWVDFFQVSIGIFIGILFSLLFYGVSKGFFVFLIFYLISHMILVILVHSKFKDTKKINSLSNYSNSKISLLLIVSLFIAIFLILAPVQEQKAQEMEAGIVDMFVGDDLVKWLGTSYDIKRMSTKATIDGLKESKEYIALEKSDTTEAKNFTKLIDQIDNGFENKDSSELMQDYMANLDQKDLKNQILDTISSIPMMVVMENYFAIIFALLVISIAQVYFSIAFSLIGLLYVFIFYKLFVND